MGTAPVTPEECLASEPEALAVLRGVEALLARSGIGCTVRTSRSQVAFRRRRGFAYLWVPGRYLNRPAAPVVLSIALGRALTSARFKEVAHPAPKVWMHHLELHTAEELDDEVAAWLREAADRAG